ncbi:LOW QUALITY PROTEIN: exosome complex exonuclease RRP44 [Drosophila subobscura]|uniref:LOW QUALITY PROTEIN: exosome complex exonuclease RRP44 n=1 Tax=Drosophila subobscura TaxID=7241 RepID=UPI00155A639F|nr:LOW QUALITY PROTEIN: exosome complex exonuclease RRP44 [Drosophila subobscura]
MQTLREFTRKTKRGNILKIVREHYLRDDIGCGSDLCKYCFQNEVYQLTSKHEIASSLFKFPHYLVLDTNVVLDQIDVLEEDVLHNVIVLTTVLNEVKHKSSSIYKRFNEIIHDRTRNFYVFVNEHHKDTYADRDPGETANDRNDRAIRMATKWYDTHLDTSQSSKEFERSGRANTRVVLLTDDAGNRAKAEAEGILVASATDYVKSLEEFPLLVDKLSHKTFDNEKQALPQYPAHLSMKQVLEGLRLKKLLQGAFQASRENYLEGSVNVETYEKGILIQGRECLNRAVDGDLVAVELLPESEWSAPSEIVLEEKNVYADDVPSEERAEEEKDMLQQVQQAAAATSAERTPTGRIVGIVRRKWRQYCGILQPSLIEDTNRHIFVPADRKIPRIRIETRQAAKLQNQRIIVTIDTWPRNSRYPQGHFVRSLGPLGDMATENEVILLEHDVPHCKFSEEVLSFLPKMPWSITAEDYAKRVDLRDLFICSVDPPGCTDIDDALHCRELPNGNYEVGVHIADVSHFIRPGNALDQEAAARGTTVYLVGKRIDMVPELLSSNLCSLVGGVERFAFSCIWEVDKEANVINKRFHKSVIKSKRAMTYEEAQVLIDDATQQNEIAKSLRQLNRLAKILKKRRMDNGALVLASPEIRFQVDSETHEPLEVEAKQMRETNSMVEEFMLLANITVAEHIAAEFTECAVLRRHPKPPPTNFDPLVKAARYQGFQVDIESGLVLSHSLDKCVKEDNPYFNTMIRILTTRCMMQAVYFISGSLQKEEFFHYGLAAPIYTHFTSPIRRYSDIMVHRLLAASIGADSTYAQLLERKSNEELCHNLNYRHKMAQYAGRASVGLNTHLFFRGKEEDEEAYVLFVRKNALQVLIPKYGLEGTLYLKTDKEGKDGVERTKSEIIFTFNEEDHTQRCGNVVFHSFDPVTVRLSLDSSNVQHEKLVFRLVKPYIKGFSVEPSADADNPPTKKTKKDVKKKN